MNTEKACARCGAVKPLSEFGKNKQCKDGTRNICKSCVYDKYKSNSKLTSINRPSHKKCSMCGETKSMDSFGNSTRHRYGKRPQCKQCIIDRRTKNKKQILEYSRRWHEKNEQKKPKTIYSTHCKVCVTCKICKPLDDFNNRSIGHLKKHGSCRECQNKYRRQLRNNNKYNNLSSYMRDTVRRTYLKSGTQKNNHTVKLLGYNRDMLLEHLDNGEISFKEFLNNRDKYHIDHIIPLSYFVSMLNEDKSNIDDLVRKANSLCNLRIITKEQNLMKGDKICIPLINKYKLYHLLS